MATIAYSDILHTTEIINFLREIVQHFGRNLNADQWDFIRIAISSWVLTVSKSSDSFRAPKVAIFMTAVYKFFTTLYEFIENESDKSSTHLLKEVIEEWEQVFAKDVNLILLRSFIQFTGKSSKSHKLFCVQYHFISIVCQIMRIFDQLLLTVVRIQS